MPEYVQELRDEVDEALAKTNGVFEFETIKNLTKMDSFLKESQRWTLPSYRKFTGPT
jgi:hypothetical protein